MSTAGSSAPIPSASQSLAGPCRAESSSSLTKTSSTRAMTSWPSLQWRTRCFFKKSRKDRGSRPSTAGAFKCVTVAGTTANAAVRFGRNGRLTRRPRPDDALGQGMDPSESQVGPRPGRPRHERERSHAPFGCDARGADGLREDALSVCTLSVRG